MPRHVRNFFTTLHVDGRKTSIKTGPRSGVGGFDQTVYMRVDGQVDTVLDIRGITDTDGVLTLRVSVGNSVIYEKKAVR